MIVYTLLSITLLLAFMSLLILWRSRSVALNGGWSTVLLGGSLAVFIYLFGAWVFISIYLKHVFGLLFILCFGYVRFIPRELNTRKVSGRLLALVRKCISAILVIISVLYFTGTVVKPHDTINLELPFKRGSYFVFQGGRGLPTNVFHFFGRRTLYAMDIIKLNKTGGRGEHIFSKQLTDYSIFADTIYSPANGRILKVESGNPDNIPPSRKRGPTNTNQVLLETVNAYIFLGHMKQHSVFVHEGDSVLAGQPLGLAGNSGASIEPHLHIQAHAKTKEGVKWYQQPQLMITFNGKFYNLNDVIPATSK